MGNKKLIIVGLLILMAAAFMTVYYSRRDTPEDELRLSGNVEVIEVNLGFKFAGRVVGLLVNEGDHVESGQTVARLDNADVLSMVTHSKAVLHEANARLAELRAGSRAQEVAQAKARVAAQEADLTRTRRDFERAEMLHRNGAISTSQFDSVRSAYEAALAQYENAREALSLVKEGPRQEDIRIAEHRVAQARASLDGSKQRLRDTALVAPVSGVILRKNIELGETVGAGVPVYTIGDLSNPWVKVYVPEPSLGKIKLGQEARVSTDSFPDRPYPGRVTFISSEAEFTPKQVQTHEERVKLVFGMKIAVENENRELKPGMPADVVIRLQE